MASSCHGNNPCRFFRDLKNGAFNVCFFVEFDAPPGGGPQDRSVVRISIPCRMYWVEEKLEVEIATMRYELILALCLINGKS